MMPGAVLMMLKTITVQLLVNIDILYIKIIVLKPVIDVSILFEPLESLKASADQIKYK